MKKVIQIGVFATRAPDGTFNESTPIYRSVDGVKSESNLTQAQEDSMKDLISDLAERYKIAQKQAKKEVEENEI